MLNIGILDDQLQELKWSDKIISQYLIEKQISHQIFLFQDERQLKNKLYNRREKLDIIFLDIEIGITNGLQVAEWLNEMHPTCLIVFLTSYTNYFMDAYKTEHCYYILKSELVQRIGSVFHKIERRRNQNKIEKITIETGGKTYVINKNEIVFLEKEKRLTHIQCEQTRITTYHSLEEIEQMLSKDSNDFLRCHKIFVVSLNHVTTYSKKEFGMNNGIVIPISRRYKENVNLRFLEWGKNISESGDVGY